MSDDGEKTCPLCMEEMDLTDQQLRPCTCRYDICVWCWHQIIDMAEKEGTEGRCPACRTPYDKERIGRMAAKCERVVAGVNSEKRQKSQRSKPHPSAEARKHLTTVRVVQRNLAYIVGLPSSLADETLLERKEYFGQYGKVVKVSIAHHTNGTHQASNNNTFSVYITYAREEEAVKCIQTVHNFVLEGKPLRACFGTTKYCHSWLRNMTCSNPDCLYLHDIGCQEDSFAKDEVISAYTRSRIPQMASNNLHRRSGSVLPPPADDLCNGGTVSSKNTIKSAATNLTSQVKPSLPSNVCVGKPTGLPAAASWGTRASNCRQPAAKMACSRSPARLTEEIDSGSPSISSVALSTREYSAWQDDDGTEPEVLEAMGTESSVSRSISLGHLNPAIESNYKGIISDLSTDILDLPGSSIVSAWDDEEVVMTKMPEVKHEKLQHGLEHLDSTEEFRQPGEYIPLEYSPIAACEPGVSSTIPSNPSSPGHIGRDRSVTVLGNNRSMTNIAAEGLDKPSSSQYISTNKNRQDSGSVLSGLDIDKCIADDQANMHQHQSSVSSQPSLSLEVISSSRSLQYPEEHRVDLVASVGSSDSHLTFDANTARETSDVNPVSRSVIPFSKQSEDVTASSDDLRNRYSDVGCQLSSFAHRVTNILSNSSCSSNSNGFEISGPIGNFCARSIAAEAGMGLIAVENESISSNGHAQHELDCLKHGKLPDLNSMEEKFKGLEISDHPNTVNGVAKLDIGESSIIANILSLDFDPLGDTLSETTSFVNKLREDSKCDGIFNSSLWKLQNNNESRFSFARQDNQGFNLDPPSRGNGIPQLPFSLLHDSCGEVIQNGQPSSNFVPTSSHVGSNSNVSSGRTIGGSWAKISPPPGFPLPNELPRPGFSSHDRYDLTYSGNHHHSNSAVKHQIQFSESTDDMEFYDPAILAVGKGRLPPGVNNSWSGLTFGLPTQTSSSESDRRLQFLRQQHISAQQDLQIADHFGNRFLLSNDSYFPSASLPNKNGGISPFAQIPLQQLGNPHVVHNQWEGWNNALNNNGFGIGNSVRNERYGLHNVFPGNQEYKFHISSSADLYNRSFSM